MEVAFLPLTPQRSEFGDSGYMTQKKERGKKEGQGEEVVFSLALTEALVVFCY